jgi:hypothetical protein
VSDAPLLPLTMAFRSTVAASLGKASKDMNAALVHASKDMNAAFVPLAEQAYELGYAEGWAKGFAEGGIAEQVRLGTGPLTQEEDSA